MESMAKQETPSDLTPSSPTLVGIQNEVREYFGWTEEDDKDSAVSMLRRVESGPGIIELQLYRRFSEES